MKKCTKCLVEKDTSDFKKILRRGKRVVDSQCVECLAAYKRNHYKKNRQYYLDKTSKWVADNPEKVIEYSKTYYADNAETIRAQKREYTSRPEVRERQNERFREYRKDEDFLYKERSRGVLNKRIQSGKIVKPNSCSDCGEVGYVEAHHEDYSKPLDVIWLCKLCHEDVHHSNEGLTS